jgi:hypothetical protein
MYLMHISELRRLFLKSLDHFASPGTSSCLFSFSTYHRQRRTDLGSATATSSGTPPKLVFPSSAHADLTTLKRSLSLGESAGTPSRGRGRGRAGSATDQTPPRVVGGESANSTPCRAGKAAVGRVQVSELSKTSPLPASGAASSSMAQSKSVQVTPRKVEPLPNRARSGSAGLISIKGLPPALSANPAGSGIGLGKPFKCFRPCFLLLCSMSHVPCSMFSVLCSLFSILCPRYFQLNYFVLFISSLRDAAQAMALEVGGQEQ